MLAMTFLEVKAILDYALVGWQLKSRTAPDLSSHQGGAAPFSWQTRAELLAAWGHGYQLIQPGVIGNGMGDQANLIIDLRRGIVSPARRMPLGGPYLDESLVQLVVQWINEGCLD